MPVFRFRFAVERESVSIEMLEGNQAYSKLIEVQPRMWECDRFCPDSVAAAALADQMASALFVGLKASGPKVRSNVDLGKVLWEANRAAVMENAGASAVAQVIFGGIQPFESLRPESQLRQREIASMVVAAALGS